ncbi:hypothetical protein PUN28_008478 [Cardiocondyla obscurior]|uniref:Uncharacterized protein n=1 Tax=Cardiocondyla obscurior TaxID=286306 RepID=A0AAW2FZY2_9HYME
MISKTYPALFGDNRIYKLTVICQDFLRKAKELNSRANCIRPPADAGQSIKSFPANFIKQSERANYHSKNICYDNIFPLIPNTCRK